MKVTLLLGLVLASEAALHAPRLVHVRRAPHPVLAASAASLDGDTHPTLPLPTRPPRLVRALPRAASRTAALFATSLVVPGLALAAEAAEHLHLGQKVALFFQSFGLPDWLVLTLISATPAIELRGGVPVGAWMGLSPWTTLAICVLGNMAPIAPMLLALRSDAVKSAFAPLMRRAEKKLAGLPSGQSRTLALALFVGIPAPGTGAWTGAIIAYLLDMPFGTSMGAILAGVLLAGGIMTTLTLAGRAGALVALGVLCAGGVGAILKAAKDERKDTGGGDE